MSSYDNWKTTDPADADPYRDDDCPVCGAGAGYRCAPECDCPDCAENPREKGDDDGQEYGHPGDHLKGID